MNNQFSGEKAETLLSTQEAAIYCGLAKKTLEKYRWIGGGPIFHKLGVSVRYRLSDLDDWIDSKRFKNTSQTEPLSAA